MSVSTAYTPTASVIQDRIDGHGRHFAMVFADYFTDLRSTFDHPVESVFSPRSVDLIEELARRGGKRQRAAFVYEAARLAGLPPYFAASDAGALAIELLQTSLLIHDDLVDNSPVRRGGPSTFGAYGSDLPDHPQHVMGLTVMAGDMAGYLALDVLLAADLPADLIRAMSAATVTAGMDTFSGQIIDLERDLLDDVPSLEFLNVVSDYKSGRYSAIAPMRLGLLAAGYDPALYDDTLNRYSTAIGISGQMRDDYISFFGDPAVTGKPAGVDVRAGRISYPIRQALVSATDRERDYLRAILGRADATDADVRTVQEIALVHRADGILRSQMQHYAELASAEAATWSDLWDAQAVEFFVQMPVWGVERVQ